MQIEHDRREFGFDHCFNRCAGGVERVEALLDETFAFGKRAELERHLDRHGQSSAAADEQLLQIIARDVFHDLTARLHDASVGQPDFQADDIIANGAVAEAARAAFVCDREFRAMRRLGFGGSIGSHCRALASAACKSASVTSATVTVMSSGVPERREA